ncbi:uncharacterized protein LOC114480267 isoform X2 [Gouania willdenowi]|uniref:uncharacterized protein LOC114480267 isoform X2 n=1 Tax=Gouania willdenowi TaxID=441366 RepID=UPI0010548C5F|nr:uncharacterized protein LOC114480267 isoform X2 [Gouania willdenowi]
MEDTHKKAVFASSLIKNVISKKMQFEQERKMERGEIKEQHQMSSMSFTYEGRNSHQGSALTSTSFLVPAPFYVLLSNPQCVFQSCSEWHCSRGSSSLDFFWLQTCLLLSDPQIPTIHHSFYSVLQNII